MLKTPASVHLKAYHWDLQNVECVMPYVLIKFPLYVVKL